VGVGDDQLHPGQAAGDQPAQKRQPPGAVLGGGDIQAEDLPVPVGVDPGRDQRVHVHHPPGLAHLHRERVHPHERVRPLIQGALAERADLGVEVGGHLADLRAGQRLHPELFGEPLHPPRADPEQVGGGHHGDQGLLGPAAVSQQPVGKERALPQLGHRELDGPRAGVPLPSPVAVAPVRPLLAALTPTGAADLVGLGGHHRVRQRGDHLAQHIR
jgi:collagen type II alpha